MPAFLMPPISQQWFKPDGTTPLSGGSLTFYAAGTTTLKTVYADQAGTTPLTNPVELDASGKKNVFLGTGGYKVVLKDASGAILDTIDGVYGDTLSAIGGGVTHNILAGRNDEDAHPIGAITNLEEITRFNVVQYGAVPDYNKVSNTGTDNTAAFQAAAAAAAFNGGVLHIPAGSFWLKNRVDVSVDMYGPGEICIDQNTVRANSGYGGESDRASLAIWLVGSNLKVDGVKFWCPGRYRYQTGVSLGDYRLLWLHGTASAPSTNNTITNCSFANGSINIVMGSYCVNTSIVNNNFTGNGFGVLYDDRVAGAASLRAVGSYKMFISYNTFSSFNWAGDPNEHTTTWGGDPVEINAPASGTSDILVEGNVIRDIYSAYAFTGIGLGFAKCTNLVVRNNSISNIPHDGIHVEDYSTEVTVENNDVRNTNNLAGGGAITFQQVDAFTCRGNSTNVGISANGGLSFAGPFLPNTSKECSISDNYIEGPLFVINQSNVSINRNKVLRISGSVPALGVDGIQITTSVASVDSNMQNIIVEKNTVLGWSKNIAVTANAIANIDNVRVRGNTCTPNPLSTAPANDKAVYVGTYVNNYESADNAEIGHMPEFKYYNGIPQGVVSGRVGDIVGGGSRYASHYLKITGDNTASDWLPVGHSGIVITPRTDGSSLEPFARYIRYTGTGGHTFSIGAATESGRKLTFSHDGSGSAIQITPASGTINGNANTYITAGHSMTIVDDFTGDWHIESLGGTAITYEAPTGSFNRTTFDPSTVTLADLAGKVAAMIVDLKQWNIFR